ncbi:MAG: biotin--[acetyl-CoA-carboxylase] ligase [Synechococcus sp.]|nr:biotin--[acetyl-CoA-carboxylase] ligase [Synechococcus sp.]
MRAGPLSAAAVLRARRQLHRGAPAREPLPDWALRCRPVCATTERELEQWLAGLPPAGSRSPAPGLRAVLARRQRFGHGQRGRPWQSPAGGVWLSAALPWPPEASAALPLAAAVGLALELEALGLPVRLKWPNDLLVHGRKIAGLLPRLRRHGAAVRWAQVGVGLNGRNRGPDGAISVAEALPAGVVAPPPALLAARVLRGLEWTAAHALAPQRVWREARQRLLLPEQLILQGGELWQAVDLEPDGALRLRCGERFSRLERQF